MHFNNLFKNYLIDISWASALIFLNVAWCQYLFDKAIAKQLCNLKGYDKYVVAVSKYCMLWLIFIAELDNFIIETPQR